MKAFCLGGSVWQVDLIRRAGEMGLETLVADINPDCPGRSVGSAFVQVDTNDRGALLSIARDHRINLVLAEQTDRVVPIAAFINEALELPGLRPDVAERFTNKLTMRKALQGKVPMPGFEEVSTPNEALDFASLNGYPVVLKPKRAQSSMGVFKVDDPKGLCGAFADTVAQSQDGKILLERFIDGPEITVEGLCLNGRFHMLAVSEKEHYGFNPCVARRLSYPPRYGEARMRNIIETATTVVQSLGLRDGISHAEYRLEGDIPYLVEVAARGGGNRIASCIVPHVSGVDMYEKLIRRFLGETVPMPAIQHRAAVLDFLDFAPGHVAAIRGLDEVRQEGLAVEIQVAFKAGDSIVQPSDDRRRLGYAIVLGETRDEVDARCARIKELVQVEYA
jgi:carbamoyl-phosphate synthase large subunit